MHASKQSTMESKARILVVEDELIVSRDICQQLQHLGYEPVGTCSRGEDAVALAESMCPDLVLMDIHLAGAIDGIDAALLIRRNLGLPVVFLTAYAEQSTLDRAKQAEPFGYIIKPFDEQSLRVVIELALLKHQGEIQLQASEQRYRTLFDASPVPYALSDSEQNLLQLNPAFVRTFGYTLNDIPTVGDWLEQAHFDSGNRERVTERWLKHRELAWSSGAAIWDQDLSVRCKNGSKRTILASSVVLGKATDSLQLLVLYDITERKLQERRILRLNRVYEVLSGINSLIVRAEHRQELFDEACRIAVEHGGYDLAWVDVIDPVTHNMVPQAQAGIDAQELISDACAPGLHGGASWSAIAAALIDGIPAFSNDLQSGSNSTIRPRLRQQLIEMGYRGNVALPLMLDGAPVAVLSLVSKDIGHFDDEELKLLRELAADISFSLTYIAKKEQLDYLAYFDLLTGLANARLFEDRLRRAITSAEQESGQVAVLLIDVQRLTWINETFGRGAGDAILREVGARLERSLPATCNLARITADTFGISIDRNDDDAASNFRQTVFAEVEGPLVVNGHAIHISIQAGIALFPQDGHSADSLFANAESALKLAQSGNLPFVYFAPEVNARITHRLTLQSELRGAVSAQQFALDYQPRVDLTSGEIVGAEALIRWQHPTRGLLAPNEFITAAEECGLIVEIGDWVIRTVCAQQASWREAGINIVPVMINVSSLQFAHDDFFDNVRHALLDNALDPGHLDLELTETAVMQDPDVAAITLKALRGLGVGLSLDDFGTGFSSLAKLKHFPFTSIKIDRQFVIDITHNTEDAAITTAIIAMGHGLRLTVVAEGVETEGQLTLLRARGCNEMQGFIFSPGVPADDFAAMLIGKKRLSLTPSEPQDRPTLLVVDDEPGMRTTLMRLLRRDGYRILTASSGSEALDLLAVNPVQVIMTDQRMPGMSGIEFLDIVKNLYPRTVRIILSGYTDLAAVTNAVNRGAVFRFLTKPWDDDKLREQVRDAFRQYKPDSD